MKPYTENQLRATLRNAAARASDECQMSASPHGETRHRWIPAIAVAAVVCIIGIGAGVVASSIGGGAPSHEPGSAATGQSDPAPTASHALTMAPERPTLAELFDAIGYRWRLATDVLPTQSADDVVREGQNEVALGLVWVGEETFTGDNEATGPVRTTWRLSWVVAGPPHDGGSSSRPYGAPAITPSPSKVVTVVLIDARTGERYAYFTI